MLGLWSNLVNIDIFGRMKDRLRMSVYLYVYLITQNAILMASKIAISQNHCFVNCSSMEQSSDQSQLLTYSRCTLPLPDSHQAVASLALRVITSVTPIVFRNTKLLG